MKIGQICLFSLLVTGAVYAAPDAPVKSQVTVKDDVIHFFPDNPESGIIAHEQIGDKQLWGSAVRRSSKTRQIRITTYIGQSGTKTLVKFRYPFSDASATWNMDVKREGDIVSLMLPWNGTLIGDIMDVNEGQDHIAAVRKKLGVTEPDNQLPVLYSSGDSISMGYWPYLEAALHNTVNVYYQRELAKDMPNVNLRNNGHAHLACGVLQTAYTNNQFKPDYLLVNFGLHMINTHKDKLDAYDEWVKKFIAYAKEKKSKLIWVTTTPYQQSFRPTQNLTIIQFNDIMKKAAALHNVPVIDLHACTLEAVKALGDEKVYVDGVHFFDEVKKRQAAYIANRVRKIVVGQVAASNSADRKMPVYKGRWVEGQGDRTTLELIDQAFESMQPSPRMACLPLLYKRDWDGLVEATIWPGWWIQNTFGPSYGMMPFLGEPYATWLEHSQGLWFQLMGNGKRKDSRDLVGPDGCLCDAAGIFLNGGEALGFGDPRMAGRFSDPNLNGQVNTEWVVYRQGDGNVASYDWFIGATAAGLILESERLLVRHDPARALERLPQLRRVAVFLDSRRDPKTNLLKAGRAVNLLAPAYGGYVNPDGTPGMAYLTEISVNYAAGLARLAEVCDMTGNINEAKTYRQTAAKIRDALPKLMDEQGSFIMSLDPDGTRHGVFGAKQHGYFEATPNHDAVCMGVVDDAASKRIIQRMMSIPELAPHGLILPNYPSYDDHSGEGNMHYGTWVNGGHWTTTQGRMSIACMRVGEYGHPFNAWKKIMRLMQGFRADAPLGECGQTPWRDKLRYPTNVVYDCWGAPGGLLRGLFEYDYRAHGLRIRPHLPAAISKYVQKWPVMFGKTRIYLTVTGRGAPRLVTADSQSCNVTHDGWINLELDAQPGNVTVEIVCGTGKAQGVWKPAFRPPLDIPSDPVFWHVTSVIAYANKVLW